MSTSKEQNYSQALPIGGGMYPVGPFPLVVDKDVAIGETDERLTDYIPIILTQKEYNSLIEADEGQPVKVIQNGVEVEMIYDPKKIYFVKFSYEEITE